MISREDVQQWIDWSREYLQDRTSYPPVYDRLWIRGHELDPVGTVLDVVANGGADLVDAVGEIGTTR